jgi:hypothetical protein
MANHAHAWLIHAIVRTADVIMLQKIGAEAKLGGLPTRAGEPPVEGGSSSPSICRKAESISASRTLRLEPGNSLNDGWDSTAYMSDAHDERIMRFSASESRRSPRTSSGES